VQHCNGGRRRSSPPNSTKIQWINKASHRDSPAASRNQSTVGGPQRATLLVKGGGTAWLDGNVSDRSGSIYNHAMDRSRESGTFSVLS